VVRQLTEADLNLAGMINSNWLYQPENSLNLIRWAIEIGWAFMAFVDEKPVARAHIK
jgi:hypothetical protein